MEARDAEACGKFRGLAAEADGRSAAALAMDFDLAPADVAVPSSTQRLHGRLFRGETGGVALIARAAARFAVSDLAGSVDAGAKARPGRGALERLLDAVHFDQVDSGSCNMRHGESQQSMNWARAQAPERLAAPARATLSFKQQGGRHGEAHGHGQQGKMYRERRLRRDGARRVQARRGREV